MNFRKARTLASYAQEPALNMAELAKQIEQNYPHNNPYAPPAVREAREDREEKVLAQVQKFGDLPTQELDNIVTAAEQELAALKADAQAVRDLYQKHTTRIRADLLRLREGMKL